MKKKIVSLLLIAVMTLLLLAGCGSTTETADSNAQDQSAATGETKTDAQNEAAAQEEKEKTEAEEEAEAEEELEGTQDIVIFGVDSRSNQLGKGTRSDSIMLVHIDHDQQTIKVASIYRDTMLHIEGHGYEKVTHAHSYGGPELGISTINENLDLDFSNYVTVNFSNVGDVIDKVGGISIDLDSDEVGYINSYIDENNKVRGTSSAHITEAGTYTLDGTQAVAYSRIRYTAGADYKRSERQREVLFKLFDKAKGLDLATRVSIGKDMLDEINTNLSSAEMTSLFKCLSKYEITAMDAFPQVFYGGKIDGAWVEAPVTLNLMAASIHEFLYGETDYTPSETVNSYSSELEAKAPAANDVLQDQYSMENSDYIGNAENTDSTDSTESADSTSSTGE